VVEYGDLAMGSRQAIRRYRDVQKSVGADRGRLTAAQNSAVEPTGVRAWRGLIVARSAAV
jgi:hypothetical protein